MDSKDSKPAPANAPTQTHRIVVAVSLCAALLSCTASLFAIFQYMKKPEAQALAAPAPQPALPQPAQAAASAPVDMSPEAVRRRERFKEFFSTLTPEQRARWRQMTPEERKAFRASVERQGAAALAPASR